MRVYGYVSEKSYVKKTCCVACLEDSRFFKKLSSDISPFHYVNARLTIMSDGRLHSVLFRI